MPDLDRLNDWQDWEVRDDDVTGGLVIERSNDLGEEDFVMLCPEVVPAIASLASGSYYVNHDGRQFQYIIEFDALLMGVQMLKITKLFWYPDAPSMPLRFNSHHSFVGAKLVEKIALAARQNILNAEPEDPYSEEFHA